MFTHVKNIGTFKINKMVWVLGIGGMIFFGVSLGTSEANIYKTSFWEAKTCLQNTTSKKLSSSQEFFLCHQVCDCFDSCQKD